MGLGRILIVTGAVLLIAGIAITVLERFTGLGRLPGDIAYRRGNFTFYFPWVTSLVLSLLLTAVMWFFGRSGR
jgi:hypothetical protein